MFKQWLKICSGLVLCLHLQACIGWHYQASQHTSSWHNINHLSARIYHTFPEAPPSHIQVTYDQIALSSPPQIALLSLRFYLPTDQLKTTQQRRRVKQQIQALFREWQQSNLECLQIKVSEYETFLDQIEFPLREVQIELVCG